MAKIGEGIGQIAEMPKKPPAADCTPLPRAAPRNAPGRTTSVSADELAGKTRTQIRDMAQEKGLKPAGQPDPADGLPRKWKDPVTNEERLRLDRGHVDPATGQPYNNPNAAVDHVHGYEPGGAKVRDPLTNDPHFPTTGN